MEILISTSKIKEQDMSSSVSVTAGKATKTKPAMATITVSTAKKKNAATITFKPTKEATLDKPKYEAKLTRMGRGFFMKNASECIDALRAFGFNPKDGKPIREFFSGKITAAQFKKAMGTKKYEDKEDVKASDVVKKINAATFPSSGKGKITRKLIDKAFEHYQSVTYVNAAFVNSFLKVCEAHNKGKATKAQVNKVANIFARKGVRNPKLNTMRTAYEAIIKLLREGLDAPVAKAPAKKAPAKKAPAKKAPAKKTSQKAPAGKTQGTQIANGDFSIELPIESKLTAAEANKIMAYFSKLLESKDVAKAQCNRALKELVEGTMSPAMQKRWLARVGGSSIRPVPRKLVTLLRGDGAAKPKAVVRDVSPDAKRSTTPQESITKAITRAGFKGTLATRKRGDLVEVYYTTGGEVIWSWNSKTNKAVDYTANSIGNMYSTLDLASMPLGKRVTTVADIFKVMS